MFPSLRSSCIPLLLILAASSTFAQVQTGTPPYGSFDGGPDIINLANLNSHITVPVLHRPGRGTDFTYDLSYDSSVWYKVTSGGTTGWQPVSKFGWKGQTEVSMGYITFKTHGGFTCPNPEYPPTLPQTVPGYYFDTYVYHDSYGVSHPFNITVYSTACGGALEGDVAVDGSGYSLQTDGAATNTITAPDGTVTNPPVTNPYGAANRVDRNGNRLSVDTGGHFFDTLSSTTAVLTVAGAGTAASPMTFTYTAASGGSAYTMRYTTYTVQTNFGCSSVTEYGANGTTTAPLVSEIDLPDGSKYTFAYEPTPGVSGHVTGRLASVTLPTGGTISYTYTGGNNGITCADGSASGLKRFTPDTGANFWNYTRTAGTGAAYTTLLTDPLGNDTKLQFQGIYETQRQAYQGSSTSGALLRTTNTCYNGAASPCTATAIALPITQVAAVSILPGTNNLQSKRVALYNAYGLITELDEYDFGSGAPPSTPLRKTLTSYASLGNGIVSMPASVTVKDGSNNVKAQTTLTYDQSTPVAPSGTTPQHVAVSGSRGNATTIASLVQGSTTLNQTSTYYDTGMVRTLTDVNGAVTTYNFSDATSTCGNAFPTTVSEPLSMSKAFAWNCNGGVLSSLTDENSKVITATYNDPYFWR